MVTKAIRLVSVGPFLVLISATFTLAGCAAYQVADSFYKIAMLAHPDTAGEGETNQRTFPQSIEKVYAGLLASVERDGRRVIDRNAGKYAITVSYPLSWSQWGGTITVSCTVSSAEEGSELTAVHIFGNKSDSTSQLTVIGNEILNDLAGNLTLP